MTTKPPDFSELNHLAIEACDMWQEHLSTLASNPDARAELTRFLEPQRRIFADWASMMQQGMNSPSKAPGGQGHGSSRAQNETATADASETSASEASAPETSRGSAHGDDSLRVAQLALRVAELEKRLAKLESKSNSPRKAQREAS